MFYTRLGIRLGLGLCVELFQEGAISISRLLPFSFSSVLWFALAPPLQQEAAQPVCEPALQISLLMLILPAISHLLVVFKD